MNKVVDWISRHWVVVVLIAWALFSAWFVYNRWGGIQAFALPDTDDNLRISQVRALLAGQDWYDLRQYRLSPPLGADIHWSRLVDLPLAGLLLVLRPLVGGAMAERLAVTIAPMLPLLLLLFSLALITRRLVDARAYPLTFVALFFAGSTSAMFMPLRIDHHGWQLALLALAVAGMADPKRARGGATLGIASALSLAIGLELLIYLAILGTATVLFWVIDAIERRRLAAYAVTLGGGTALSFLLFASFANRQAVCDALSPVWLSDALLGSALLLAIAWLSPAPWTRRLLLAAGGGLTVAAFHALAWPQCLSRLEGVSPEVYDLWLSHVREARPVYRHGWDVALQILAIPLTGVVGWSVLAWSARGDRDRLRRTIAAAAPALAATLLLFWQTRTGPAAQMLGTIGAVGLMMVLAPIAFRSRNPLIRVPGPTIIIVLGLGAAAPLLKNLIPKDPLTPRAIAISKANRGCMSLAGLGAVARQPKGMVFTFVDLGPRLITVTHHDAVIGPYHRNGQAIADVMKAFRGDERQARALIEKYESDYVLICPNMSTSTIFRANAPKGFYVQLEEGKVPDWLEPVALPEASPFRMWRVVD